MLVYNSDTHSYEGEYLRVDGEAFNAAVADWSRGLRYDNNGERSKMSDDDADAVAWTVCLNEDNWTTDMDGVRSLDDEDDEEEDEE